MQGWECPVCHVGVSPYLNTCPVCEECRAKNARIGGDTMLPLGTYVDVRWELVPSSWELVPDTTETTSPIIGSLSTPITIAKD